MKRAERRWEAIEASVVIRVRAPKIQARLKRIPVAGELKMSLTVASLLDFFINLFFFFAAVVVVVVVAAESVSGGAFLHLNLMNT